jgi:hypothetical protein
MVSNTSTGGLKSFLACWLNYASGGGIFNHLETMILQIQPAVQAEEPMTAPFGTPCVARRRARL